MVKQADDGVTPYSEVICNELYGLPRRITCPNGKVRVPYADRPVGTALNNTEYVSLDSMTPFEREVFDRALAALSLPLSARQAWFTFTAKQMMQADQSLGVNPRAH